MNHIMKKIFPKSQHTPNKKKGKTNLFWDNLFFLGGASKKHHPQIFKQKKTGKARGV